MANGSYPMYNRVSEMASGFSLIFAFGGTNDWALYNKPLGTMYSSESPEKVVNTNPDTFYGGLNLLYKNLITKFPTAMIFALTPLHRGVFYGQLDRVDTMPNNNGNFLIDYVNAIKESAEYYSIPVIDLYGESGLNPNISAIASAYFDHEYEGVSDLLHPDVNGHERIAKTIMRFL